MRISFLAPHVNIAGGTRAILKYSDLLTRRGHDVEIVVPVPNTLRRNAKRLRAKLTGGPRWQPTRANVRFVPSLESRHLRPADVTVATAWKTAYALDRAADHVGDKYYLVQHYESLYHGTPDNVDPTYGLGLQTIVISDWLAETLDEKFGVSAEVIVTPVDEGVFFPRAVDRHRAFRICMMYHDQDWKDVRTGIEAVRRFRATGREAELVLFGATPAPPQIFEGIEEFHLQKSQDELAMIYSSCDVYLCPSWFEGLGMPAMEAMACGCALVTTDTGGSRSYADHGVTAMVAEQKDADGLANHLAELFDHRGKLRTLQQQGRQRIRGLRWQDAADRMEALFETSVREGNLSQSAIRSSQSAI